MKNSKRIMIEYNFQKLPEKVVVWSEADFAGRERTRRSNSGGVVMFGKHSVKTYSQTQEAITLSSGESEFCGTAKAAMGLGTKSVMADLRFGVEAEVSTDSSAAKSITARRGAGPARHVEVRGLGAQYRVAEGEVKIVKVKGGET